MSRVIRGAVWKENPHCISTPKPPKPEVVADEENTLDEAATQRMLAEIAAKEQRASDMLKDAQVNAEIIRQQAQTERDNMLAEAQQEIEQLKEQAQIAGRQAGYEAGHADGEAKAREEMQEILLQSTAQAEKTLQDAKNATRDYVQQAEKDITTIVMQIVEKILPQHFIDVPQIVLPLVQNAIYKVKDQKELIIHVPPDSYDIVLLARDEFRNLLTYGDAVIEIKPDESMKMGDCLIETPNGSVDARLATQIELIKQAVQEVML